MIYNGTSISKFFYFSDHYIRVVYNSGSSGGNDTGRFELNSEGLIGYIGGSYPEQFFYDTNNQLALITTSSSPLVGLLSTDSLKWDTLGDMTTQIVVNTYDTTQYKNIFNYDLSKRGQTGDFIRISQFIGYGRVLEKTSRLPVSMQHYSVTDKYDYQFDSLGRITKASTSAISGGYTYQYY